MTFRESIRQRGRGRVPFHEHDGSDISGEIVASVIKVLQLLGGTITGEEIIIAGGVDGILRSDNFVAGSDGWRALGDGTFEAQDGIFRGTLNADDMVAGTLAVARIAAKTLTLEKLIIGSVDNLIQNPGFETGILSPHNIQESSNGTWVVSTAATRSGDFILRYDFPGGGMGANDARVDLNGPFGTMNAHPQAAEGDQFHLEIFARESGSTNGTTLVAVQMIFRNVAGSSVGTATSTFVDVGTSYAKIEVEGTAPAGVAYVQSAVLVDDVSTSTAGAIRVDDCYARRRVGTLIIEDQAVDVERLLEPVHQDGGQNSVTNITVNTTLSEATSVTLSIPSFVGVLNSLLVGSLQMTETSVERLLTLTPKIAGTAGFTSQQEISNAGISETITFPVSQHRGIVSPGSTVKWSLESKVSTGSNTTNQHELSVLTTGER